MPKVLKHNTGTLYRLDLDLDEGKTYDLFEIHYNYVNNDLLDIRVNILGGPKIPHEMADLISDKIYTALLESIFTGENNLEAFEVKLMEEYNAEDEDEEEVDC